MRPARRRQPASERLANTLAQVLETAKHERDHEVANALLVTTSSNLQSEAKFPSRSCASKSWAALTSWQSRS
jgi:hypothetical protein